jgi:[glutamine synthetase] adenylyltransferase / [glutamine synthetase]-adenylyl-L-tyrosine phosphorylase
VIYDAEGVEESTGPRPLATRPYYARLTQAFVTALSAQTAEGRLYEVDVRLRPSGRKGPVATSLESFISYQNTEAWTWEHLALTRARVLAGDAGLAEAVEAFRRQVITEKGQGANVLKEVAEMRARLAEAKAGAGGWDVKLGPGRLMDIELLAQTVALISASPARQVERQIAAGGKAGILSHSDQTILLDAYRLCWRIQAASKLLSDRVADASTLGLGGQAFLLREAGEGDAQSLTARLERLTRLAEGVIVAHLEA